MYVRINIFVCSIENIMEVNNYLKLASLNFGSILLFQSMLGVKRIILGLNQFFLNINNLCV